MLTGATSSGFRGHRAAGNRRCCPASPGFWAIRRADLDAGQDRDPGRAVGARQMPRDDIDRRADRAAGIHRIGPLPDRKPGALSGGRCLQVATGRTPVRDADLFLFDGPPSNPDAKPRSGRRGKIRRMPRRLNKTGVCVTHDQIKVPTLADRIAVMRAGITGSRARRRQSTIAPRSCVSPRSPAFRR